MPLEAATYIADLVTTNPLSTDQVGQGDDHLRLIKQVLQNTLPNMGGRVGRVQQLTGGYTVLSTDNTAILEIPTAAAGTVTHTISLPALSSITAGFHFELFSTSPTHHAQFVPTGGATIEGAASSSVGPLVWARVMYNGTNWRVARHPIAQAGTDAFTLPSTLTVSGAVTLHSGVSVSGAAHFKTTASFGGNVTMAGTLTVSSAAVFQSGVSISGTCEADVMVASVSLNVAGAGSFGGLVNFSDTISVSGAASFASTVTVVGAATLASTLSVSGAAHMKTTLSVGGATTLNSTLTVIGATSFMDVVSISGAAHVSGTLSLGGAATMSSTLTVSGAATMKTTLSVGGATVLGSTLTVSGAAVVGSTLVVAGAATFSSTVTISGTCVLTNGQLQFPATANPSANANTLDDYEEGTFTPALNFGGATTGITYTTQSGVYNKTGGVVWTQLTIVLTSKGSAVGAATITGYPFSNNVQSITVGVMGGNANMSGLTSPVNGTITATTVSLFDHGATGQTAIDDTNFANNTSFRFTLTYGATS